MTSDQPSTIAPQPPVDSVHPTARQWLERGLWPGVLAYVLALAGILILGSESTRLVGVVLVVAGTFLAVLTWGRQRWIPSFPEKFVVQVHDRRMLAAWGGVAAAGLAVLVADLYCAANPGEVFGLAGWLWLVSMVLLVASTLALSLSKPVTKSPSIPTIELPVSTLPVRRASGVDATAPTEERWAGWEVGVFAGIVLLALVLRVWNLSAYPYNIYPDEIMTGTVASQSFGGGNDASIFSTVWPGIDLPALWFRIVWGFVQVGGSTLSMLRLPAALFGAATTVPFYFMVRGVWGRAAAIGGTAILAFSASNVHFSRLALNNIVTAFFWAVCFCFLLRGLRSRNPVDWAVAGLAAGVSEHFYYGTRLLPFVLVGFFVYLLVVHWKRAWRYVGRFGLLALGYVVGFGPLLAYFVRDLNLYFGRGAQLSIWHTIPTSLDEFGRMVSTLWPVMAENLLGFSSHSSQDIIFYAPLLFPVEAALLALGAGLLVWKWKHPAAFLMLLSGVGVLFVGGTIVMSFNSAAPQINHWPPAFPAIYAAIAIPIGALVKSGRAALPVRMRWVVPAAVGGGLLVLGVVNINFYFNIYHSDPERLVNENYRRAQEYYEAQTAQSRYVASLGEGWRVVRVGQSAPPYDAATTYYLMGPDADVVSVTSPDSDLALVQGEGKKLAFIFFPGSEQYMAVVREKWPVGVEEEVKSPAGELMFHTYEVPDGK